MHSIPTLSLQPYQLRRMGDSKIIRKIAGLLQIA